MPSTEGANRSLRTPCVQQARRISQVKRTAGANHPRALAILLLPWIAHCPSRLETDHVRFY